MDKSNPTLGWLLLMRFHSVSCDKTFLCYGHGYVGIESWESRTFQVAYHCKVVFSAGADKRILVWDVGKAHKLCELKGHTDTIYQLMFSRDGSILASGVCRVQTRKCHLHFLCSCMWYTQVVIFLIGGLDNCVKLWDVSTFEAIGSRADPQER